MKRKDRCSNECCTATSYRLPLFWKLPPLALPRLLVIIIIIIQITKTTQTKIIIIKGSLEEKLPSYEKLRSACVQVHDAKRSRLTVARVGTLGAAHVRRMCGAVAAAAPVEIEA